MRPHRYALFALAGLALAGCAREGELAVGAGGVGITAVRSACPAVGVPDFTGDITTFTAPGATTADAIDVTAAITNVRSTCNDTGTRVYSEATFDVVARRADAGAARTVALPYYTTVLRGGTQVVSKRIGQAVLSFGPGAERAQTSVKAGAFIDRAEASLPPDIRERITKKREPGDPDAALDPLADPQVRAAVQRATFELLVGFQLNDAQLAYNATR